MKFDIRPATVVDAAAIHLVALESWPATYQHIFAPEVISSFLDRNYSVEALEQAISFTLRDSFRVFEVAVDESSRVVGFLQMADKDGQAFVWRVYVLPECQRQGIGAAFLARLEDHLRAHSRASYGLMVHGKNEIGKAFYLQHGFVHRPEQDQEGEWFMQKDLGLYRSGNLLRNLILFGRILRGLGLDVNPGRMIDLVIALDHIQIGRKADFYHAASSLLVHSREDQKLFDEAFELFWQSPVKGWELKLPGLLQQRRRSRKPLVTPPPLKEPESAPPDSPDDGSAKDQPPVIEVTLTYSAREVLRHKNFADLTQEELQEMKHLMAQLLWQLGERRTRRRRPGHGDLLDLRRTLRRNLKYGGDIVEWARREPKYKPRPIVLIADISGSMERYTRLLLHFIYSLTAGLDQPVESFVFSTRLTRITHELHNRDVDQALRDVSNVVNDWAGGTRIGDALKTFNFQWGRRVLGRGAVVLLISDGWDRGDVNLLGKEMARLQRTCHRLIWLNPLLGSPEYEPLTRGIVAALPHIDDFLPVHNLASLEELAIHLSQLKSRA